MTYVSLSARFSQRLLPLAESRQAIGSFSFLLAVCENGVGPDLH